MSVPAPGGSTLFGAAASSSPFVGSTLFGSSSRTDPFFHVFGSSSSSGNASNSGFGDPSTLFKTTPLNAVYGSTSPSFSSLFGTSTSINQGSSLTSRSQSPLMSTVTTTSAASTAATTTTTTTVTTTATTTATAATPAMPVFGMTALTGGKDGSVAATESFSCSVTSNSAATFNAASSVSGFSPTNKTAETAGALQPQTSVPSIFHNLSNEKEINPGLSVGEIKRLKDIFRFLSIRTAEYQDKDSVQSPFLQTEGQLPMVPRKFLGGPGVTLPSERLGSVETVLSPSRFSSQLTVNSKFILSPSNDLIMKQIFDKYGDITSRCIMKSTSAKSTFLLLVADIVERLGNHTLQTLSADELQLMEMELADAKAVGFDVDWLRHRVDQVIKVSKYNMRVKQVDELGKLMMEMELQQVIWKKEVSALKVEMEGDAFSEESNLLDGLL